MIDHIQIPRSLTVKALRTWAVVAVVGVTAAFTVADAAAGAKLETYVGSGALYGDELPAIVPPTFSTDLQVFGDRIRLKGEVSLIDGHVVGGALIGAGVRIDLDAPDDEQITLRISSQDHELQFDLSDLVVSAGSHVLLIDMVLVDGDVTYSIGLELDHRGSVQAASPRRHIELSLCVHNARHRITALAGCKGRFSGHASRWQAQPGAMTCW